MGSFFSKHNATFDPAKDIPDLTGKVIIVTGGNSGIGFATVQQLARRGAKVYMAARSEARAAAAIARLRAEGLAPGNGEVVWHALDLGDPRSAKASAEAFATKEGRLDVLVNNAGLVAASDKIGPDGVLESMMTNHFGPFIFTKTLLPLLKKTAQEEGSDVRVVVLTSESIRLFSGKDVRYRNIDDFNQLFGSGPLNAQKRYAKSKLANALFAKELQRKVDGEGVPITVLALHPGAVLTEGVRKYPALDYPIIHSLGMFILNIIFLTPVQGAVCSLFAATAPAVKAEPEKYKGALLWTPCDIWTTAPAAEDKKRAEELWNATEAILKQWDI